MALHPLAEDTPLDVAETLGGKRILFVGATGFVGKVTLSMLLRQYPGIGKVHVLVRPGAGSTSEERFFRKIAASPVFDPLRAVWGAGYEAFLREKVDPLAGDVSRPALNFSSEDLARLGRLDAVINCAGLVSFDPPLESALRINTLGVKNVLEVCRRTGAALIHVSTCFVAGNRDGEIWEDEEVAGYFPRRDRGERQSRSDAAERPLRDADFSVEAEIADCQRLIAETRARADDRAHVSLFRDRGAQRLRDDGRDADDERTLKVAVQRERKLWMHESLTALGSERAKHWGWPNTYTYTKSLGEQVCTAANLATGAEHVRCCIVRPSVVESSVGYPFAGWNEGFNTTAPLAMLGLLGHRTFPSGEGVVLDIIPVDMVAAGMIAATAATLEGKNQLVYQLSSGDQNPFYQKRVVELVGHYKRIYYKRRIAEGEGSSILNRIQARLETVPTTRERFERTSAPLWHATAAGLSSWIGKLAPRWGAPRVSALVDHAREKLDSVAEVSRRTQELFQQFMPFIYERRYIFRADQTRRLFERLTPPDRAALPWAPEGLNWREYWLDVHMPGLEKWVFPSLEEEFKAKPKSVYTYKDLLELFDATTKHHRHRTAMRLLPPPGTGLEPHRYTYGDLQEMAARVATTLRRRGVAPGDKVLLVSENRPEWGITYFGVLKAGAAVVPVDHQSSFDEVVNLMKWSRARAAVISGRCAERLRDEGSLDHSADAAAPGIAILRFDQLLAGEPTAPPAALAPIGWRPSLRPQGEGVPWTPSVHAKREGIPWETGETGGLVHQPKGDDLASLIFTSGTTGRPKGVMLSHRNFSSLLSKMAGVFDIDKHDGLLSVLPLHHTFEFTAGLLMPLMRGAQIAYLDEVNADALSAAFDEGNITGMIGVPALWQLLHRKITKTLSDRGPFYLRAFELLVDLHRRFRDGAPGQLNLGRLLFLPVHRKLGGRVRLMISGGSALPPDTMKVFRGLGFQLFEGYGLTEAAPVLTVNRPGTRPIPGSVGEPLPGIDVRIDSPDANGVGEVVASGPNVMMGYFEDPETTALAIKDGWLHTGDLGRFDEEKRLYIVGRRKEVILGANGENVYPDELEDVYRDSPYVKELSIVGLPEADKSELVACLVVPEYNNSNNLTHDQINDNLREHIKNTSSKLPHFKRIKVLYLTDLELPKTATRKVKRKLVVEELQKLERLKHKGEELRAAAGGDDVGGAWLADILAAVSGKPVERVRAAARLDELGFDSLMYTELGVALEAAGVAVPAGADLTGVASMGDFERLVESWGRRRESKSDKRPASRVTLNDDIAVPKPVVTVGNAALNFAQRMTYERMFHTRVTGAPYIPRNQNFIVAANHSSHLDMGLVKHALGDWGVNLVALAAKDYFFEDPVKRAYFENFTNLVPMDRFGSLRESLRLAADVLHQGYILLIFPEGTRSTSGVMTDFKPSVSYLALSNKVGVLPMYLEGTHDALPKGSLLPKHREIAAHVGPFLSFAALQQMVAGHPRAEHNRVAAQAIEAAVRKLAPTHSVNYRDPEKAQQREPVSPHNGHAEEHGRHRAGHPLPSSAPPPLHKPHGEGAK